MRGNGIEVGGDGMGVWEVGRVMGALPAEEQIKTHCKDHGEANGKLGVLMRYQWRTSRSCADILCWLKSGIPCPLGLVLWRAHSRTIPS